MNRTIRTEPSDLKEYNAEAVVNNLIDNEKDYHPKIEEIDLLYAVSMLNSLEGKKRERINTLLSDAIKKYDCAEFNIAIENELEYNL